MEKIVTKKKTEDIEDAEIVVNNDIKSDVKTIYQSKILLIFLSVFLVAFIFITIGFFIYFDRKMSREIFDLQTKTNSFTASVSIESLENKMSDLAEVLRQENIDRIDGAVVDLKQNFNKKIDSLNVINLIKSVEANLLKLEAELKEDISEITLLRVDGKTNLSNNIISDIELEKEIKRLHTGLDYKITMLTREISRLEHDFLQSKKELTNFNKSIRLQRDKPSSSDMKLLTNLKETFPEIAYAVLKTEAEKNTGGTLLSMILSTIKSVFIVRSTAPRAGSDTDAILSRAEHELNEGNLAGCMAELEMLDDDLGMLFLDWKKNVNKLLKKNN